MRCKGCACCPCHWEHDEPHSYVKKGTAAWHAHKEAPYVERNAVSMNVRLLPNIAMAMCTPRPLPRCLDVDARRAGGAPWPKCSRQHLLAWPAHVQARRKQRWRVSACFCGLVACSACGVYDSLWHRHCSKQSPRHPPPPRTEGTPPVTTTPGAGQ